MNACMFVHYLCKHAYVHVWVLISARVDIPFWNMILSSSFSECRQTSYIYHICFISLAYFTYTVHICFHLLYTVLLSIHYVFLCHEQVRNDFNKDAYIYIYIYIYYPNDKDPDRHRLDIDPMRTCISYKVQCNVIIIYKYISPEIMCIL